ncbi:enoyl-CoA hydratase/isomerase family protein [Janibacter melonis]|uniref:enoyl-CoA hydratase/isomerase family protein n=1 Tax=Janibacter melonis TaxID=262209 RepID=UPI001E563D5D|nr:enoyl-CoA hydratase/isomerase family protein [Janibacter melonis]MCB5991344.1 enoyl-CoA hydratase/isomerase family protein [Janibacter melonis]
MDASRSVHAPDDDVISELVDGVLTIWLNRPDKLNALTHPMYDEIGRLVAAASTDTECRVIVLRGRGRAFSAGFDLALQVAHKGSEEKLSGLRDGSNRVRWAIWNCPKPVVAVLHGFCLAGAFELVLPTDFTIASRSCELGEPEILFGAGSAFLMVPWMMNHKQAKQVLLLGDRFDADEAHRLGLVTEVVDDDHLDQRVHEVVDRLRKVPAGAARMGKLGINRAYETAGMVPHIDGWVDSVVHLADFPNEVAEEFKRRVEQDGPKQAAQWRASYYEPEPYRS